MTSWENESIGNYQYWWLFPCVKESGSTIICAYYLIIYDLAISPLAIMCISMLGTINWYIVALIITANGTEVRELP